MLEESQPKKKVKTILEDEAMEMAKKMAIKGLKPKQILNELIAVGVNPGIAAFVSGRTQPLASEETTQDSAVGKKEIFTGGLVCFIGILITLGTYTSAVDSGGGRYVVAWGAILFGGIQFFRGLVLRANSH